MTRGRKTAVFSVVGLFLLLAAVGYCFRGHQGGDAPIQKKSAVPPGTLTGVMYSDSGGMTVRDDFFIWLSPDAIVETFYYPEEPPKGVGWHEQFEKENVPITEAQWSDVEQIILELYPLMKPIPENLIKIKLPPLFPVMDGVAATDLTLTWSTEDGIRSIRYHRPNDRRIHTLTTLLKELADPIGREIPRYAPPELSGFYMGQSGTIFSKDYSFQFDQGSSDVYGEDAPYILRARFTPPGQQQEIWRDWAVPDEEWDAFAAFVEEIDLEEQLDGRTEKPACTLYYSDGKQQQKKLDQETAKQIRAYLTEMALRLLEEQE